MAIEVAVKVAPGGLRVTNIYEARKLEQYVGKEVQATLKIPRNYEFHQKFFALLQASLDMVDEPWNMKQWRRIVTCGMGYCTFVEVKGELIAIPESISFASMDDLVFQQFYQDALQFICTNYLLDETPEELDLIVSFM